MDKAIHSFGFPLSPQEKSTLYFKLAELGAACVGEKCTDAFDHLTAEEIIVVASETCRFSPRLLGILIDFFVQRFRGLNPFQLAALLPCIPTPQGLGVIAAFAKNVAADPDLKSFFEIVLRGIKPAPWQYFYNPQTRPRPMERMDEIVYSPQEFKQWGFWSNMDPFLKEKRPPKAAWKFTVDARKKILKDLLRQHRRIRLSDYLNALGHSISRQQAHLDLISMKGLKATGKNRGRWYSV